MTVTVYSKKNCAQCDTTKRHLNKIGVDYSEVDITKDMNALDYVLGLGYQAAPVVTAGDDHWSGYRPEKISQLAAA